MQYLDYNGLSTFKSLLDKIYPKLDDNNKIPSSYLPSYVDDVLEFDTQSSFPTTGESGKIYLTADTNKSYRWTGSGYAEISSSLALGETSATAYRGDRGKTAYDHSQKSHSLTIAGNSVSALGGTLTKDTLLTSLGLSSAASDITSLKAHVANGDIHVTADDKTSWNSAVETLDAHTKDTTIHITSDERTKWNNNIANLSTHIADSTKHITASERTAWNAKWDYNEATIKAVKVNNATTADKVGHTLTFADGTTFNGSADKSIGKAQVGLDKVENKTITVTSSSVSDGTNTFNKYTHPTHSAVTIASADGRVLGSISVDSLGHVTSVGYKALGFADMPSLYIGKTKVQSSAKAQALTGISSLTLEGSTAELKWDGDKSAWRLSGNLLVDGFVASGGTGSSGGSSGGAVDVSYVANLTAGTLLGTLTINGTDYQILAPSLTASSINAALGNTPVARATADAEGNSISGTYAKTSSLPTKVSQLTNDSGYIKGITKAMVEGVLTGNITSHTHNYLPLTGGTLSGSGAELLKLDSSNSSYNAILFKSGGVAKSEFGFTVGKCSYIYDYTSGKYLGVDVNGTPFYGALSGTMKYALIHSGNIESYAVKYDNGSSVDTARHSIGYDNGSHGSISLPHAGGYISFGHDTYGGQLLGIPNGLALYYRGIANNAFSDWKTIAFLDSNVASSSKWSTARTITVTGSVTGSVSIDGSANVTLATTTNHTHSYAGSLSAGGAANSALTLLYKNDFDTNYGRYAVFQQDAGRSELPHTGWFNTIKMLHNNSSGYFTEIATSFTGEDGMWRRALQGGSQAGWYKMLDSGNFNSYSPKLDGTGASGTWGINVTGAANCLNPTDKVASGTTSARPLVYSVGQPSIGTAEGNAYAGSSNDYNLLSFPIEGTVYSDTYANIMNLRLSWNKTTHWHDIFASPNTRYLWHRNVQSGSAHKWCRIVEEDKDRTWGINISGDANTLDGVHYQNILERQESGHSSSGTETGWFRIAETTVNAAYGACFMLSIERAYNNDNNESYIFAISISYGGGISITQLSGYANARKITKIRADWAGSNKVYIDLYIYGAIRDNAYYWYTVGAAKSYSAWAANPTLQGTAYEFTTVNGCKSDRGFTGDLSGNASSATNADTVDGYHAIDLIISDNSFVDLNEISRPSIYRLSSNNPNLPSSIFAYGNILNVKQKNADTAWQLLGAYSSDALWFRRGTWYADGTGTLGTNAWKEIAFLDSNVASATKLATARTIWGQSFDGTGNVSGALTEVTSITASGDVSTNGNLKIGDYSVSNPTLSIVDANYGTWKIQVKPGYMQIGYGDGPLCINGNGNVGIDITSPSAKLHVNGNTAIEGNALIGTTTNRGHRLAVYAAHLPDFITAKTLNNAGFAIGNISDGYGLMMWTEGNGHSHIQAGRTDGSGTLYNLSLQRWGGNVGIGTASPSAKLHVNGNLRASSLTLNGTNLLEWDESNSAWKFNGNLIATGFIASGDISAQATALAEEEDRIAALEAQVAELQAEIENLKAQ